MSGTRKIIFAIGLCIAAGCGPKPEAPSPEPPEVEHILSLEERLELAEALMEEGRVGEAADHYQPIIKSLGWL